MTSFRFSQEAAEDLFEIYEYIAQDSVEAAERVRIELLEAMRGLARCLVRVTREKTLRAVESFFGLSAPTRLSITQLRNILKSWRSCTASGTSGEF